jgi:Protein of unknown function (DUF3467)
MSENKEVKQVNIEIQIDKEMENGQYVNMVVAQHSPSEFVIDYIFIPPGQKRAKVQSRIIMAPEHVKKLLHVLTDNVSRYEKRFGEIKLQDLPAGTPMQAPKTVQ